jgi:hypothetical protein
MLQNQESNKQKQQTPSQPHAHAIQSTMANQDVRNYHGEIQMKVETDHWGNFFVFEKID